MPNASKQNRRLTRCRTGCMRCRVRRRKCWLQSICAECVTNANVQLTGDEGKPRCRNCVDRGFECQYGPQLTFLTKNAHTVQAWEVGSASPAAYENIRFIKEDPQKDDDSESARDRSSSPDEDVQHSTKGRERERTPERSSTHRQSLDVEILPQWEADGPSSQGISSTPLPTTVFSDNDESAVAGLLALGTSTNEPVAPNMSFSDFAISPPMKEASISQTMMTPGKYPDSMAMAFSPGQFANGPPTTTAISSTQTLELLRHYRYEVAPWLDICDLGQLFGIQGLQLAMAVQPVWYSVMALSESSMKLLRSRSRSSLTISDQTPGAPGTPEAPLDITTLAFLRAIDESKNCIANFRASWSDERVCDMELLETLGSQSVGRSFNSAIYWLFVRLDLAAALATDTDMRLPLLPPLSYLTSRDPGNDQFEDVFCFALRPLWLCARAVQFVHNDDPSPQNPPLHTWMHLMEELDQWYQERPQGFQPMMDVNLEDPTNELAEGFPIVLFAHGSGVFSNQLYHTAMLLLLHNRPRTARTTSFHSTTTSPLWHAQRICSIAVNNERRECWDPVLLASFLAAARRMTHESQQQEILRGFERIRKVTGWDISDFLQELQEEWGVLESY